MSARLVLDESTSEGRLLRAFRASPIGCTCCQASKRAEVACSTAQALLPVLVTRGLLERVLDGGVRRRPQPYRITGAGKHALDRGHQDWPEVFDGA